MEELIEIGGDFGRLELDQPLSRFLWVFRGEVPVKFAEFSR